MPIKPENYKLIRQHFIKLLGGKCTYCGLKETLEFDHKHPNGVMRHDVSRSVREWEWFKAYARGNLMLLCRSCNAQKNDMMPVYFPVCSAIL